MIGDKICMIESVVVGYSTTVCMPLSGTAQPWPVLPFAMTLSAYQTGWRSIAISSLTWMCHADFHRLRTALFQPELAAILNGRAWRSPPLSSSFGLTDTPQYRGVIRLSQGSVRASLIQLDARLSLVNE